MTNQTGTDTRRRTLLVFLFVMAFQQGVTINLLPVLFTNFAETFQLDLQQRGQIQSFFFVGAMVALQGVFLSAQAPTVYSLASNKFADRAGTAVPLVDAIGAIGAIPAPPR